MEEVWKPIYGYEGLYEVSNIGRIRRLPYTNVGKSIGRKKSYLKHFSGGIMRGSVCANGYIRVTLNKQNHAEYKHVHRLVAEAFIENPQKLPCINHRNEIKTDNRVENLEWCSYGYNNTYNNLNKTKQKKMHARYARCIRLTNVANGETSIFASQYEVATFLNTTKGMVLKVAKKKRKTLKGYIIDFV